MNNPNVTKFDLLVIEYDYGLISQNKFKEQSYKMLKHPKLSKKTKMLHLVYYSTGLLYLSFNASIFYLSNVQTSDVILLNALSAIWLICGICFHSEYYKPKTRGKKVTLKQEPKVKYFGSNGLPLSK